MITSASMTVGNFYRVIRSPSVLDAVAQRGFGVVSGNAGYNLKRLDSNKDIVPPVHSVPNYRKAFSDFRSLCIDGASSLNDRNMTLDDLSDAQLYAKLVEHGYPACPVTPTTRKVLIKKLQQLVGSKKSSIEDSNEVRASGQERRNTPKSGLNLQTSFASTFNPQKLPASTPNLQKSSACTSPLKKFPANTHNLRNSPEDTSKLQNCLASSPNLVHQLQLVFFDIETSGLEVDCDILQISVRCGSATLNRYVDPTRPIAVMASNVNHLYNRDGDLYKDDELLDSQPLPSVLLELYSFLQTFEKKCVLVAHNCPFDSLRLMGAIKRNFMEAEFAAVVDGFADTLKLFREKYPERRWQKGALKLMTLVDESLDLSTEGAHDAHYDTLLLEKLAHAHFTPQQLLNTRISFEDVLCK